MYNTSLFTHKITENKCHIIEIVTAIKNPELINIQSIFCDINELSNYHNPVFHTYFLMAENKLVISDATAYNIAGIFPTNNFICIDDSKFERDDFDNVEFVDINLFTRENVDEFLGKVLESQKYEKYKV